MPFNILRDTPIQEFPPQTETPSFRGGVLRDMPAPKEIPFDRIQLADGQSISQEEFNALPEKYKQIVKDQGIVALNEAIDRDNAQVKGALLKIEPYKSGEGYDLIAYLKSGNDVQTLRILGFNDDVINYAKSNVELTKTIEGLRGAQPNFIYPTDYNEQSAAIIDANNRAAVLLEPYKTEKGYDLISYFTNNKDVDSIKPAGFSDIAIADAIKYAAILKPYYPDSVDYGAGGQVQYLPDGTMIVPYGVNVPGATLQFGQIPSDVQLPAGTTLDSSGKYIVDVDPSSPNYGQTYNVILPTPPLTVGQSVITDEQGRPISYGSGVPIGVKSVSTEENIFAPFGENVRGATLKFGEIPTSKLYSDTWKPDFSRTNPYDGVPIEYIQKAMQEFVPTPENPLPPFTGQIADYTKDLVLDGLGNIVTKKEYEENYDYIKSDAIKLATVIYNANTTLNLFLDESLDNDTKFKMLQKIGIIPDNAVFRNVDVLGSFHYDIPTKKDSGLFLSDISRNYSLLVDKSVSRGDIIQSLNIKRRVLIDEPQVQPQPIQVGWKPDFTQITPYENVPQEYITQVKTSFVPTVENPLPPFTGQVVDSEKGLVLDEVGNVITSQEYNSRLPEIQARAKEYSEAILAKDHIKLADETIGILPTGETYTTEGQWVTKEYFNSLPQNYQSIGKEQGYNAMQKSIEETRAKINSDAYKIFKPLPEGMQGAPSEITNDYDVNKLVRALAVGELKPHEVDVVFGEDATKRLYENYESALNTIPVTYQVVDKYSGAVTGWNIGQFVADKPDKKQVDILVKAGFPQQVIDDANTYVDATNLLVKELDTAIIDRDFQKYNQFGLNNALKEAGFFKAVDDLGIQSLSPRDNWISLSNEDKLKVAGIYANDPNVKNVFASQIKAINIMSAQSIPLSIPLGMFSIVATPIAKATTGQHVEPIEWAEAGGMVVLTGLSFGGASALGALGRVGLYAGRGAEAAITTGFIGTQTKSLVTDWTKMTAEQRAVAIGMDALMLLGLKSSIKGIKDVPKEIAAKNAAKAQEVITATLEAKPIEGLKADINKIAQDINTAKITVDPVSGKLAQDIAVIKDGIGNLNTTLRTMPPRIADNIVNALMNGAKLIDDATKSMSDAYSQARVYLSQGLVDDAITVLMNGAKGLDDAITKVKDISVDTKRFITSDLPESTINILMNGAKGFDDIVANTKTLSNNTKLFVTQKIPDNIVKSSMDSVAKLDEISFNLKNTISNAKQYLTQNLPDKTINTLMDSVKILDDSITNIKKYSDNLKSFTTKDLPDNVINLLMNTAKSLDDLVAKYEIIKIQTNDLIGQQMPDKAVDLLMNFAKEVDVVTVNLKDIGIKARTLITETMPDSIVNKLMDTAKEIDDISVKISKLRESGQITLTQKLPDFTVNLLMDGAKSLDDINIQIKKSIESANQYLTQNLPDQAINVLMDSAKNLDDLYVKLKGLSDNIRSYITKDVPDDVINRLMEYATKLDNLAAKIKAESSNVSLLLTQKTPNKVVDVLMDGAKLVDDFSVDIKSARKGATEYLTVKLPDTVVNKLMDVAKYFDDVNAKIKELAIISNNYAKQGLIDQANQVLKQINELIDESLIKAKQIPGKFNNLFMEKLPDATVNILMDLAKSYDDAFFKLKTEFNNFQKGIQLAQESKPMRDAVNKISEEFSKAQAKLGALPESQISSDVISAIFADAKNAIAKAKDVNSKIALSENEGLNFIRKVTDGQIKSIESKIDKLIITYPEKLRMSSEISKVVPDFKVALADVYKAFDTQNVDLLKDASSRLWKIANELPVEYNAEWIKDRASKWYQNADDFINGKIKNDIKPDEFNNAIESINKYVDMNDLLKETRLMRKTDIYTVFADKYNMPEEFLRQNLPEYKAGNLPEPSADIIDRLNTELFRQRNPDLAAKWDATISKADSIIKDLQKQIDDIAKRKDDLLKEDLAFKSEFEKVTKETEIEGILRRLENKESELKRLENEYNKWKDELKLQENKKRLELEQFSKELFDWTKPKSETVLPPEVRAQDEFLKQDLRNKAIEQAKKLEEKRQAYIQSEADKLWGEFQELIKKEELSKNLPPEIRAQDEFLKQQLRDDLIKRQEKYNQYIQDEANKLWDEFRAFQEKIELGRNLPPEIRAQDEFLKQQLRDESIAKQQRYLDGLQKDANSFWSEFLDYQKNQSLGKNLTAEQIAQDKFLMDALRKAAGKGKIPSDIIDLVKEYYKREIQWANSPEGKAQAQLQKELDLLKGKNTPEDIVKKNKLQTELDDILDKKSKGDDGIGAELPKPDKDRGGGVAVKEKVEEKVEVKTEEKIKEERKEEVLPEEKIKTEVEKKVDETTKVITETKPETDSGGLMGRGVSSRPSSMSESFPGIESLIDANIIFNPETGTFEQSSIKTMSLVVEKEKLSEMPDIRTIGFPETKPEEKTEFKTEPLKEPQTKPEIKPAILPEPARIPEPLRPIVPKPEMPTITKIVPEEQLKELRPVKIGEATEMPPKKPPRLPPKMSQEQEAEYKRVSEIPATLTWRSGMKWVVLPPREDDSYHTEDMLYFDKALPGTTKFSTGKGSSYRTLQVLHGVPKKDADVDLGWTQIHISAKGKELQMTFGGGKEAANERWSQEQAQMDALERESYQDLPQQTVSEKIKGVRQPRQSIGLNKILIPEYSTIDKKVYAVDGAYIRSHPELYKDGQNFTQGSNWKVDDYVPEGEHWVDRALMSNPTDFKATVLHELAEPEAMGDARGVGKEYRSAHETVANPLELEGRKNPEQLDTMIYETLGKEDQVLQEIEAYREKMRQKNEIQKPKVDMRLKANRKTQVTGIGTRKYLGKTLRPASLGV